VNASREKMLRRFAFMAFSLTNRAKRGASSAVRVAAAFRGVR
jgi:hypothetical protein